MRRIELGTLAPEFPTARKMQLQWRKTLETDVAFNLISPDVVSDHGDLGCIAMS